MSDGLPERDRQRLPIGYGHRSGGEGDEGLVGFLEPAFVFRDSAFQVLMLKEKSQDTGSVEVEWIERIGEVMEKGVECLVVRLIPEVIFPAGDRLLNELVSAKQVVKAGADVASIDTGNDQDLTCFPDPVPEAFP